jgi:hypothetical protein
MRRLDVLAELWMRRLPLFALLLLFPEVARADGLPGTTHYFYPLTGCTVGGDVCVTAQTQVLADGRYWTDFSCTWTGGSCTAGVVTSRGFIYREDGTLIYRTSSGTPTDVPLGGTPNFGVITGTVDLGNTPGVSYGTILVTTPEPGTLALLSSGLVALAGTARRRRRGTLGA